jgi:aspartate racemase
LENWVDAGRLLAQAALALQAAGAECIVLCTNTMHKVADAIEGAVGIPLLHIADPTADEIKHHGVSKVGLLGTRFTMEQEFYRDRLKNRHGIEVYVPTKADREIVHGVIYDELCLGKVFDTSRIEYLRIIDQLREPGAEAVILGCTEITMLVGPADSTIRLFDTTNLHATKAAEWSMAEH